MENGLLQVKIFQNRIPDYRVPFFLELIRIAKQFRVEVNIYISSKPFQNRGDEASSDVPHTVIRTPNIRVKNLNLDLFLPSFKALGADLYIVEFGIRNIFQILFLKIFGRGKLAFWGHGEERSRNFSKFERFVRRKILFLADYFFVYTPSGKKFLVENEKFPTLRIFVVNNSTDTNTILAARSNVQKKRTTLLPKKISVENRPSVMVIASLEKSKKVHEMLEIHKQIRALIPNFETIICGDGPQRQHLEKDNAEGVHFLGRVSPIDLVEISKYAIAIVSPGPVGLVVTDSFALGVPIIASHDQNHGPEFSYLVDGYNSLIIPTSPNSFVQAIVRIIYDNRLREELKMGLSESVKKFSIDIMVRNFMKGIISIAEMQK